MSQYATPTDVFTFALPPKALPADVTPTQQNEACIAASAEADSHMRGRYSLPILGSLGGGVGVFDPALVKNVAYIAAHILMTRRGFAALAGSPDDAINRNYDAAIAFFSGVQRQNIHLDVIETAATSPNYQLPQVRSHTPRGI